MRRAILVLVAGVVLAAQTPLPSITVTGPALAKAGSAVTVTVGLLNGAGPAGVQWDMTGLPAAATITSAVTGKTAACTATRCIVTAATPLTAPADVAPIADGPIATIAYTQPATAAPLAVLATVGATPAGAALAITPPTGPLTIPVQSNCDVNGDGKIDATDVGLVLQAALASTTGSPTVLDVIREIVAANGGSCLR